MGCEQSRRLFHWNGDGQQFWDERNGLRRELDKRTNGQDTLYAEPPILVILA